MLRRRHGAEVVETGGGDRSWEVWVDPENQGRRLKVQREG